MIEFKPNKIKFTNQNPVNVMSDNYSNDPTKIDSILDVLFNTKALKQKYPNKGFIGKRWNAYWDLMHYQYVDPIKRGKPSDILWRTWQSVGETLDVADNVIKAFTTPLVNRKTDNIEYVDAVEAMQAFKSGNYIESHNALGNNVYTIRTSTGLHRWNKQDMKVVNEIVNSGRSVNPYNLTWDERLKSAIGIGDYGRINYEYQTGNVIANLALEVLTGNWDNAVTKLGSKKTISLLSKLTNSSIDVAKFGRASAKQTSAALDDALKFMKAGKVLDTTKDDLKLYGMLADIAEKAPAPVGDIAIKNISDALTYAYVRNGLIPLDQLSVKEVRTALDSALKIGTDRMTLQIMRSLDHAMIKKNTLTNDLVKISFPPSLIYSAVKKTAAGDKLASVTNKALLKAKDGTLGTLHDFINSKITAKLNLNADAAAELGNVLKDARVNAAVDPIDIRRVDVPTAQLITDAVQDGRAIRYKNANNEVLYFLDINGIPVNIPESAYRYCATLADTVPLKAPDYVRADFLARYKGSPDELINNSSFTIEGVNAYSKYAWDSPRTAHYINNKYRDALRANTNIANDLGDINIEDFPDALGPLNKSRYFLAYTVEGNITRIDKIPYILASIRRDIEVFNRLNTGAVENYEKIIRIFRRMHPRASTKQLIELATDLYNISGAHKTLAAHYLKILKSVAGYERGFTRKKNIEYFRNTIANLLQDSKSVQDDIPSTAKKYFDPKGFGKDAAERIRTKVSTVDDEVKTVMDSLNLSVIYEFVWTSNGDLGIAQDLVDKVHAFKQALTIGLRSNDSKRLNTAKQIYQDILDYVGNARYLDSKSAVTEAKVDLEDVDSARSEFAQRARKFIDALKKAGVVIEVAPGTIKVDKKVLGASLDNYDAPNSVYTKLRGLTKYFENTKAIDSETFSSANEDLKYLLDELDELVLNARTKKISAEQGKLKAIAKVRAKYKKVNTNNLLTHLTETIQTNFKYTNQAGFIKSFLSLQNIIPDFKVDAIELQTALERGADKAEVDAIVNRIVNNFKSNVYDLTKRNDLDSDDFIKTTDEYLKVERAYDDDVEIAEEAAYEAAQFIVQSDYCTMLVNSAARVDATSAYRNTVTETVETTGAKYTNRFYNDELFEIKSSADRKSMLAKRILTERTALVSKLSDTALSDYAKLKERMSHIKATLKISSELHATEVTQIEISIRALGDIFPQFNKYITALDNIDAVPGSGKYQAEAQRVVRSFLSEVEDLPDVATMKVTQHQLIKEFDEEAAQALENIDNPQNIKAQEFKPHSKSVQKEAEELVKASAAADNKASGGWSVTMHSADSDKPIVITQSDIIDLANELRDSSMVTRSVKANEALVDAARIKLENSLATTSILYSDAMQNLIDAFTLDYRVTNQLAKVRYDPTIPQDVKELVSELDEILQPVIAFRDLLDDLRTVVTDDTQYEAIKQALQRAAFDNPEWAIADFETFMQKVVYNAQSWLGAQSQTHPFSLDFFLNEGKTDPAEPLTEVTKVVNRRLKSFGLKEMTSNIEIHTPVADSIVNNVLYSRLREKYPEIAAKRYVCLDIESNNHWTRADNNNILQIGMSYYNSSIDKYFFETRLKRSALTDDVYRPDEEFLRKLYDNNDDTYEFLSNYYKQDRFADAGADTELNMLKETIANIKELSKDTFNPRTGKYDFAVIAHNGNNFDFKLLQNKLQYYVEQGAIDAADAAIFDQVKLIDTLDYWHASEGWSILSRGTIDGISSAVYDYLQTVGSSKRNLFSAMSHVDIIKAKSILRALGPDDTMTATKNKTMGIRRAGQQVNANVLPEEAVRLLMQSLEDLDWNLGEVSLINKSLRHSVIDTTKLMGFDDESWKPIITFLRNENLNAVSIEELMRHIHYSTSGAKLNLSAILSAIPELRQFGWAYDYKLNDLSKYFNFDAKNAKRLGGILQDAYAKQDLADSATIQELHDASWAYSKALGDFEDKRKAYSLIQAVRRGAEYVNMQEIAPSDLKLLSWAELIKDPIDTALDLTKLTPEEIIAYYRLKQKRRAIRFTNSYKDYLAEVHEVADAGGDVYSVPLPTPSNALKGTALEPILAKIHAEELDRLQTLRHKLTQAPAKQITEASEMEQALKEQARAYMSANTMLQEDMEYSIFSKAVGAVSKEMHYINKWTTRFDELGYNTSVVYDNIFSSLKSAKETPVGLTDELDRLGLGNALTQIRLNAVEKGLHLAEHMRDEIINMSEYMPPKAVYQLSVAAREGQRKIIQKAFLDSMGSDDVVRWLCSAGGFVIFDGKQTAAKINKDVLKQFNIEFAPLGQDNYIVYLTRDAKYTQRLTADGVRFVANGIEYSRYDWAADPMDYIQTRYSPGLYKAAIEARDNNALLSGGASNLSTGEHMSGTVLTELYNALPDDVRNNMCDLAANITFNGNNFNHTVLGSGATVGRWLHYSYNDVVGSMCHATLNNIKFQDAKNVYVASMFSEGNKLQNSVLGDAIKDNVSDSVQYLRDHPEITFARLVPADNKNGYALLKYNVSDIESAIDDGAHIMPSNVYDKLYHLLNSTEVDNEALQVYSSIMRLYKLGYLAFNPGAIKNNIIDAVIKTVVDSGASVSTVGKELYYAVRTYHDFNKLSEQLYRMKPANKSFVSYLLSDEVKDYFLKNKTSLTHDAYMKYYHYFQESVAGGQISVLSEETTKRRVKALRDLRENNLADDSVIRSAERQQFQNKIFSKALSWMEDSEAVIRIMQYNVLRKQGQNFSQSLDAIARTQFNYDNKSPFEKKMEFIIPFYTFASRNTLFWLDELERNPGQIKKLSDIIGPLMDTDQYDPEEYEQNKAIQNILMSGNIQSPWDPETVIKTNFSFVSAMNVLVNPLKTFKDSTFFPIQAILDVVLQGASDEAYHSGMDVVSNWLQEYFDTMPTEDQLRAKYGEWFDTYKKMHADKISSENYIEQLFDEFRTWQVIPLVGTMIGRLWNAGAYYSDDPLAMVGYLSGATGKVYRFDEEQMVNRQLRIYYKLSDTISNTNKGKEIWYDLCKKYKLPANTNIYAIPYMQLKQMYAEFAEEYGNTSQEIYQMLQEDDDTKYAYARIKWALGYGDKSLGELPENVKVLISQLLTADSITESVLPVLQDGSTITYMWNSALRKYDLEGKNFKDIPTPVLNEIYHDIAKSCINIAELSEKLGASDGARYQYATLKKQLGYGDLKLSQLPNEIIELLNYNVSVTARPGRAASLSRGRSRIVSTAPAININNIKYDIKKMQWANYSHWQANKYKHNIYRNQYVQSTKKAYTVNKIKNNVNNKISPTELQYRVKDLYYYFR